MNEKPPVPYTAKANGACDDLLEACRSLIDAIDAWKNDEDGDWELDEWLERKEYEECLPRVRAAIAKAKV